MGELPPLEPPLLKVVLVQNITCWNGSSFNFFNEFNNVPNKLNPDLPEVQLKIKALVEFLFVQLKNRVSSIPTITTMKEEGREETETYKSLNPTSLNQSAQHCKLSTVWAPSKYQVKPFFPFPPSASESKEIWHLPGHKVVSNPFIRVSDRGIGVTRVVARVGNLSWELVVEGKEEEEEEGIENGLNAAGHLSLAKKVWTKAIAKLALIIWCLPAKPNLIDCSWGWWGIIEKELANNSLALNSNVANPGLGCKTAKAGTPFYTTEQQSRSVPHAKKKSTKLEKGKTYFINTTFLTCDLFYCIT